MYLLAGANYALLVVVIAVFLLFSLLHLSFWNLLLTLYLSNILIGILPGLTSNRKQLIEFLIFSFIGSLTCSVIGLIITDWQLVGLEFLLVFYMSF